MTVRSQKVFTGTNAKRLALPTSDLERTDQFQTDEGDLYEWYGEWVQIGSGGAAHTIDQFKPSEYTGKISSDEDGTTFAIASGASKLLLQSLEVTGLEEFAVLAFGTSAANAQSNLALSGTTPNIISNAGVMIGSGDSTVGGRAPDLIIGIPANATYAAIGNGVAAQVQVIMVTQGK